MGLVFVIRKKSRARLLYKSSRIYKWQMFSESDIRGIESIPYIESTAPKTLSLAIVAVVNPVIPLIFIRS